jgi:photosystem II stability/assembly factor-like uncharacterized protein
MKKIVLLVYICLLSYSCDESQNPVITSSSNKTEAPKLISLISGNNQLGFPNQLLDTILIKIIPVKRSDLANYSFGYRMTDGNYGSVTWNTSTVDSILYVKVAWNMQSTQMNQQLIFYLYLDRKDDTYEQYNIKPTDSITISAALKSPWKLIYQYSGGWYAEYTDIYFRDNMFGIVVGDCTSAGVIKTDDGGITWNITNSLRDDYYKLSFLNKDTGLVTVTNNYSCLTYNGGKTFVQNTNWTPPIIGHHSSSDHCMIDMKTIVSIGGNGTIMRTNDGGKNWTKYDGCSFINYFNCITKAGKNTLYACGSVAKVVKSTDNGTIWTEQNVMMNNNLKIIYFLNDDYGFAAGEKGGLIRTVNGGNVWEVIPTGLAFDIIGIKFFSDSLGYIVSSAGEVAKTIDGGKLWKKINIDNYGVWELKKVWFKDSTTIIGIQNSSIHTLLLK